MNEQHKAKALAQYLDALLQGSESAASVAVDEEIAALGELGRSLAGIAFRPRPAHQAGIESLLQEHRPTWPSGGATTSLVVWGISLRWLLVLIALLAGALFRGEASPTPALSPEVLTPESSLEATALPGGTPAISLTITSAPASIWTPTASATLSPVVVVTPTVAIILTDAVIPPASVTTTRELMAVAAPTATVTPTVTVTVTPTTMVTPTLRITPTSTVTPTPTVTPKAVSIEPEGSDLAFHPEHLNAGGVCQVTYSASGSLKNHGPGLATGVEIDYEVVSGAKWVDLIEVVPSRWEELGTSKPGKFTVYVHTNEEWSSAGKGAEIVVRLYVNEDTQATFTVKSQCEAEEPDEPGKPDKPDKSKKDR